MPFNPKPKPNNTLGAATTTPGPGHDLNGVVPIPGAPGGSSSSGYNAGIRLSSSVISRNPHLMPTGNMVFSLGSRTLGVAELDSTGTATITLPAGAIPIGENQVVAYYSGDANFAPGSGSPLIQFVTVPTTTTLSSSLHPGISEYPITFTAIVHSQNPPPDNPSGTVSFYNGVTLIGAASISSNAAVLTTSLPAGTYSIVAVYEGDSVYDASESSPLSQQIVMLGTTTTLISSPNPSLYGNTIAFTATVHSNSPPPDNPTGTFNFYNGITLLGTSGPIVSNSATFHISSLEAGVYTNITAVYSGDSTYTTSTSTPITQTVQVHTLTGVVTSSQNPSNHGASVTFTATVHSQNPPPDSPSNTGGGVSFYDSATLLGSGNVVSNSASYSTSSLTVGTHSITATYNSDGVYLSSSSPSSLSQIVNSVSSPQLWMFGSAPGGGNVNTTLFIFDAATLVLNNTILGSTFGTYNGIQYPTYVNGSVYAVGNASGGLSVLKFNTSGTLTNTYSTTLPAGNAAMTYDGVNTLYISSSNGGLSSFDTSTNTITYIYIPAGSPEFTMAVYDSTSSTLGGPLFSNVIADFTRTALHSVPGSTINFVSAGGSAYGDNQVVNANNYNWVGALNGYPGGPVITSFQFLQINPSTATQITTIAPPGTGPIASAPAPYYYSLQATMCYNSTTNLIYIGYVATDNTLTYSRIDQINPTTAAISTLTSTIPLPSGSLGTVCAIATHGNSIWLTDSVSKINYINTSGSIVTTSAAVNDGVGNAGCLCYVP